MKWNLYDHCHYYSHFFVFGLIKKVGSFLCFNFFTAEWSHIKTSLFILYTVHIYLQAGSCFSLFIWDKKVQIGFLLLAPSFLLALPNELTDIASSSLFLDIVYLRTALTVSRQSHKTDQFSSTSSEIKSFLGLYLRALKWNRTDVISLFVEKSPEGRFGFVAAAWLKSIFIWLEQDWNMSVCPRTLLEENFCIC